MTRQQAEAYRRAMDTAVQKVDEEAVGSIVLMMKPWKDKTHYVVNERLQYGGKPYKVLQEHTSQSDWTPDVAPSLFAEILIPDPSVIPEWVQPSSTNPYMKDDKVRHNGKVWISLVDNNVWEPSESVPTLWGEVA
jgi:hypothetical protein